MIGIPNEGELNLPSFHNVKQTATMFFNDMSLNVFSVVFRYKLISEYNSYFATIKEYPTT